eukprot:8151445-Pyramimonas_sp.AAC.1
MSLCVYSRWLRSSVSGLGPAGSGLDLWKLCGVAVARHQGEEDDADDEGGWGDADEDDEEEDREDERIHEHSRAQFQRATRC